jgi:hypothetical protein
MPIRGRVILAARTLGLALALVLLMARDASAYMDPATGSLILQLLAAGFVTCMVIFRKSIARIAGLFRRGKKDSDR